MKIICDDLDSLGYDKVCFRSDGENPIGAVLGDIKNRWRGHAVIPEKSAEGDHQSNGSAECGVGLMKGHVRTLKRALERALNTTIPDDHLIMTWLVRHAASTYRRFHVGADGQTPL